MAKLVVVLVCLLAVECSSQTDNSNCSTDIKELEKALFSAENIKQLNKIFYPPRESTSRFITVEYDFEGTGCNVKYIWAIGGFLLMQPPKIFQLTSLYFSTLANDLTDLKIVLPKECWPVVHYKGNTCTCLHDDNILDILTQQLGEYAKVNDPDRVIRDPSIHVQAICADELKADYYHSAKTRLFMACTAVIPLLFIATLSMVVRSFHKEINNELAKTRNHGNFAAFVVVGIFAQWVIVGMDIAAVIYVFTNQHEYKDYQLQQTINLFVTAILLAFDSVVGLIQLVCLSYIWCALCHKDSAKNCPYLGPLQCTKLCMENTCPYCLIPCFYAIFGYKVQKKVWNMHNYGNEEEVKRATQKTSWIMLTMLIAPFFSIASHSGYILISWLTQPSTATSTALITVFVFTYTFLITRQCYTVNSGSDLKFTCWSCVICLYPLYQLCKHCEAAKELCHEYHNYKTDGQDSGDGDELIPLLEPKAIKQSKSHFNLQAFCLTLGWGVLLVASLAFVIISFYEIPLKTLDLVTYLLNVFQIFIVVIALLVTYKVFTLSEPEFLRFFRHMRETYKANQVRKRNPRHRMEEVESDAIDDVEASGVITAKMLEVIVEKC